MAKLEHRKLRQAIIQTCLDMNRLGVNQGTSGNVSARVAGGFLITPSGIPYEELSTAQIVLMDLDGGYHGDWLPSSEWRMHMDIYRHKDDAQAVVHTHSIYATALSSLREEVPAFHYMIGCAGGDTLRCARYATFGTAQLSNAMLSALRQRTACLLANHGAIMYGPNLKKALWQAVEVEALCKQYFAAKQMGQPVILGAGEMKQVLARFKSYGKQAHEMGPDDPPAVEAPVRRDA